MKIWTMEKFKMDKFKICKQWKNSENVFVFLSLLSSLHFFLFFLFLFIEV